MVCAYGSPNRLSEPIVKRVGYEDVGQLTRYVKVLRTRLVVDQYVHRPGPARFLSAASTVTADPLLRLVARERRMRRDRSLSFEAPARSMSDSATCGRPHGAGTRSQGSGALTFSTGSTSSTPGSHPTTRSSRPWTPDGRVAGYVVYRVKDHVRHIFDIACFDSQPVIDALLGGFLADARRARATGVTFLCLGALGLLGRRLRSFGFVSRSEDKRLRVYVQDPPPGIDLLDRDNWYFVMGDDDF